MRFRGSSRGLGRAQGRPGVAPALLLDAGDDAGPPGLRTPSVSRGVAASTPDLYFRLPFSKFLFIVSISISKYVYVVPSCQKKTVSAGLPRKVDEHRSLEYY